MEKSIKKNFVLNAILTLSNIIFPIISFPYVSRILGPSGTGKVDFAVSIINYFALLAQLGIPTYGIRACAKARDNKIELNKIVHELFRINLVMNIFAYLLFIPLLFVVPRLCQEKTLFVVVSSTLWFNAIGMEYLYRGLEDYKYITIRSIVFKFIGFIAMFCLINKESDYIIYAGITVFAGVASSILNFIHARQIIDMKFKGPFDYRRHFKPILMFFAMSCAVTIYVNLDRAMLGFMTSDDDVGYYGASVKIKTILVSLVTSLGAVLLPRASYYVEHKLIDEFCRITGKALHFVYVAATPLVVFFMMYSSQSILLVSGTEYLPANASMQIIMPTLLFIGITNIIGIQVLVPLGKERYVLYSEIVGAIVDLVLNFFLIPKYHSAGAAIGTVVAEFAVLIVQIVLLRRVRSEYPIFEAFSLKAYWRIIVAILFAVPISQLASKLDYSFIESINLRESWIQAVSCFVYLFVAAILFFGMYYVVMMVTKDKMMIEISSTIKRKLVKR